jgi:N utilization substance protein A
MQVVKKFPKISDEVISKSIVKAIKEYFEETAQNPTQYARQKDEYDSFLDAHVIVEIDKDFNIITAYIEKEVLDLDGDEPWDFTVIDINQARRIDPNIQCGDDDNPVFCKDEFDLSLIENNFVRIVQQTANNKISSGLNSIKSRQNSSVRFATYSIDDPFGKPDKQTLSELFDSFDNIKEEFELDEDIIIEKVQDAIFKTVKKYYEHDWLNGTVYFKGKDAYDEYMKNHVKVYINMAEKTFDVFLEKEVVDINDESAWDFTTIGVDRANEISSLLSRKNGTLPRTIYCGDEENPVYYPVRLNVSKLGRSAIAQAKQSLRGDIKEILKKRLIDKFQNLQRCCITGTVVKIEPAQRRKNDNIEEGFNVIISYDGSEVTLYKNEQIPNETFTEGQRVKVYVLDMTVREDSNKQDSNKQDPNKQVKTSAYVKISRTHWDFVRKLFEEQVPEIRNGTVEIKEIAREAGSRTKMAVVSHDPNVDAIGACIGINNTRLNAVCQELGGNERIDIIDYSDDLGTFVANALVPAKIIDVKFDKEIVIDKRTGEPLIDEFTGKVIENTICRVTVPKDQISLAIGNEAQNVRLAAKLTKHKIDIKIDENYTNTSGTAHKKSYYKKNNQNNNNNNQGNKNNQNNKKG